MESKEQLFSEFLDKLGKRTNQVGLMEAVKSGFDAINKRMYDEYVDNHLRRINKFWKIWPAFKDKIIGRLALAGCELVDIHYADQWSEWKSIQKSSPKAREFDAHVPESIKMKISNQYDEFVFETDVDLEYSRIGNYDALRRLGNVSNGKAAACKELIDYQASHRNTWRIPMSIFLDAVDEFADPDRYLDEEERRKMREKVESDNKWDAGMAEFYRTTKYSGD